MSYSWWGNSDSGADGKSITKRQNINKHKDLFALITRYEAYQELKENWMEGIALMERRDPQYISKSDVLLKSGLEAAVQFIQDELDKLSGESYKRLELKREVNGIPADPRGIIGGRGTPRGDK